MSLSPRILLAISCVLAVQLAWSQEPFWHQTGGPLAGQDIRSFASNSKGDLFAGTWTHGEVYKTNNNGETWTACNPLPSPNPVLGLVTDRHDHIFASVFTEGVARSTDNGATWHKKNLGLTNLATRLILVDRQDNIWVASEGGMFCSTDDGETWINKKTGSFGYICMDSTGAVIIRAVDDNGHSIFHRSTDGGSSWTTHLTEGFGFDAIHPDGSYWGVSYTGTQIFRSTDYGVTWVEVPTPVSWTGYNSWLLITPQGHLFYSMSADFDGGVIRSTNNGATWQIINDGLLTHRINQLYYHTSGFVFCGTLVGVYRSTIPEAPQDITVSLPENVAIKGSSLEIPVSVTNVSGWGICAYDFTISFNDPDSILSLDAAAITDGTLSGARGWSVLLNTTNSNEVRVGAYGATPLSGQGTLMKLKMTIATTAQAGDSTGLAFTSFLFNTGGPEPTIVNGSLVVREAVCGDADENGLVQAYDAALTMREALGPMAPPPPPLSPMGRLNADVTLDGMVQAYDAALILRHAIGLAMPESTTSCFGGSGSPGTVPELNLAGKVLGIEHGAGHTVLLLGLENVPESLEIYSYSFELLASAAPDDTTSLTLPQLGANYLATVNRIGNGHFRVGIINPFGMDVENIPLTLAAEYASSLNNITLSDLTLNNASNPVISLTNIISAIEPEAPDRLMPASYDLVGAYPNPFNPATRIVFQMPAPNYVRLEVYNSLGVNVKTLYQGQVGAGQHEVQWDGTNRVGVQVASGQYFCVMHSGGFTRTIRLMYLK